jgi:hypothetical protein
MPLDLMADGFDGGALLAGFESLARSELRE